GIRDRNVTGVQTCALPIYRVDDLPGLLAGVRAVQIHQAFSVRGAFEDREVLADPLRVQHAAPDRRHRGPPHSPGFAPTSSAASRPSSRLSPSYPFCSSSGASSGPPESTIRPAIITWTRSGVT